MAIDFGTQMMGTEEKYHGAIYHKQSLNPDFPKFEVCTIYRS